MPNRETPDRPTAIHPSSAARDHAAIKLAGCRAEMDSLWLQICQLFDTDDHAKFHYYVQAYAHLESDAIGWASA